MDSTGCTDGNRRCVGAFCHICPENVYMFKRKKLEIKKTVDQRKKKEVSHFLRLKLEILSISYRTM